MKLYVNDGDDLDENMKESNKSDEESDGKPEGKIDQAVNETEAPAAALPGNPVIDNREHKLVAELFQKTEDV